MKKVTYSISCVLFSFFGTAWAETPPNVLLIAIDDLRPELGCYGADHIQSPHLDALARNGLRFDRAYTQQAVCGPSRVCLMSGVRPRGGWNLPKEFEQAEMATLPHTFRLHGYETVSVGKIYHHITDDPNAWSAVPEKLYAKGEDWRSYVDPQSLQIQRQHKEDHEKRGDRSRNFGGPAYESPEVEDSAYPDGRCADRAIAELGRLRDEPFFLAVGFVKPHLPFNAPKRYWDLYDRDEIELPKRIESPQDASPFGTAALETWPEGRSYAGIPETGPLDEETAKAMIHGYYACVSYVDAQVGRIIAELDRLGLRENTIVVVWGDHGFKLNDYHSWCKHTNYEIDTRIPLIISAPETPEAAQSTTALVETVDVAPTLAELCGIPIPRHWEGSSLAPLLENPALEWKEAAFSQYSSKAEEQNAMGHSIRTRDWRYVEWTSRSNDQIIDRELYAHPHPETGLDLVNVAGDAENEPLMDELSQLLKSGKGWRAVRRELRQRLR